MALATPSPTTSSALGSFYNDAPSSPGSSNASRELKEREPAQAPSSVGPALAPPAPPSPYPQHIEPSPVDSTGTASTDATDIDEDEQDHAHVSTATAQRLVPATLRATDTAHSTPQASDQPLSPRGQPRQPPSLSSSATVRSPPGSAHSQQSMPNTAPGSAVIPPDQPKRSKNASPQSPTSLPKPAPQRKDSATSPLNTDLPPVKVVDRSTPRAQTKQEAEEEWQRRTRLMLSLDDIPESADSDRKQVDSPEIDSPQRTPQLDALAKARQAQIDELNAALSECWTLCTTLASLSSNHRSLIFAYRGRPQVQEQAWKSCWRLCQSLYDTRDGNHGELVLPTLEMCREFCQSLFEARQKQDEISDSVLRVSFELNNHLYNTHDRNLPSAFQERTLDFYLTLCHRLMKQRTSLPHETDSLLRACWTLAEMLFNIRQNKRDGKPPDEELLSSAVQSCWELCDLFREGWSQVRPGTERGTPRSVQSAFAPSQSSAHSHSAFSPHSSPSVPRSTSPRTHHDPRPFPPETPTTIFDDTTESPLESPDDSHVPNILVLGPDQSSSGGLASHHNRWPSSASTVSGYSESSQRTSSTATAPASAAVASHLTRVRILLVRAAVQVGFQPSWSSPPAAAGLSPKMARSAQAQAQSQALISFAKELPDDAFGSAQWQRTLLTQYRKLVTAWPAVVQSGTTSAANSAKGSHTRAGAASEQETHRIMPSLVMVPPAAQKRATPAEVAAAVKWMMRSERNTWLKDLYRFVFGHVPEDAAEGVGTAVSG